MTTPTGTPFQKPSPDWDMVTVAWAGTYLDGNAATGSLGLKYDGGSPMLDDDPTLPLSIFGREVNIPIAETTVMIDGQPRTVGYVAVQIPASNDPDITGGGGTYTFSEKLTAGGGRTGVTFVADKDVPGGVIWLNKVAGMEPSPGEPLPVWSFSDFADLVGRVQALEDGGGGGTTLTTYDQVSALLDYPETFPADLTGLATVATSGAYGDLTGTPTVPQAYDDTALSGRVTALEDAGYITAGDVPEAPTWDTLSGKPAVIAAGTSQTAARDAIGAGTSSLQLGTGSTTAAAGDHTHSQYASSSALTSHTGATNNPHSVTKGQVGLGNVDDTADTDKPISTATQTALDSLQDDLDGKANTGHTHAIPVLMVYWDGTNYIGPTGSTVTDRPSAQRVQVWGGPEPAWALPGDVHIPEAV